MNAFIESSNEGISVSAQDLLLYQSLAKQLHFPLQPATTNMPQGNRQSRIKGRGMTFADLRQYQRGDDIRLIDWRVTARTGKPHTRQYQEDRSQPFYLMIDFSDSLYFGSRRQLKSVLAAKLAAVLMWQIAHKGEPLGTVLIKQDDVEYIAPVSSERHTLKCLSRVSAMTESRPLDASNNKNVQLHQAMQMLLKSIPSNSVAILISDFVNWPASMIEQCHRLNTRAQLLLFHVSDPIEREIERRDKPEVTLRFTDGNVAKERLLNGEHTMHHPFVKQLSDNGMTPLLVSTHLSLQQQLAARYGG